MNRRRMNIKRRQAGVTAVEVMIVLMVGTLLAAGGADQWIRYMSRQTNLAAAEHMKLVSAAASRYIKDNYASIIAQATPSVPAVINIAMLRNTGYLPANFSDLNAYRQGYSVLALEPTPEKLQTLVVTLNGDAIKELSMIDIAKQIGAQGGYITGINTASATGSFGGWSTALAPYGISPGAGHLAAALFFEDGALVNDYLYRNAVPGQPNLNRMNTAIDMGGNNLNNAGIVNAQTANVSGNANITGSANITGNANITGSATINGNANVAGETYTGGWFRSRGATGFFNETYNGGWYMSDPAWVRSYSDKGVWTGGEMRAGKLTSGGRTEVGEYLQLNGLATPGTACAPNGLIGRTPDGATLSCKDGVWTSGSSGGVTDMCNINTGGTFGTDAMCAAMCSGSEPGEWRFVGSWDMDSGGGAGRTSAKTPSGTFATGLWMSTLCAKFN